MSAPLQVLRNCLRILLLTKMAVHAVLVPLYEGPDEPMHLARARAFPAMTSTGDSPVLLVDAEVVRSIRAWPCGPDLERAFGCPRFGHEPASFNSLGKPRGVGTRDMAVNYEAHQPPLYYIFAGGLLETSRMLGLESPERQLVLLRFLSLLLIAAALWLPLDSLGRSNPMFESLLLVALLLPGASESLVRVANDVGVFGWSLLFLYLTTSTTQKNSWILSVASAIGPLLKLTALPIALFGALRIYQRGRPRAAALVLLSACLVFPVQWARGWKWGGTLEATASASIEDSLATSVLGVMQSFGTLVKTAIWLGGWTGFRAPLWLLLASVLAGVVFLFRGVRRRVPNQIEAAHVVSLLCATAGVAFFAIGHRRLFGVWGAVGGWYAWGWAPWLCLTFSELFELRSDRSTELFCGLIATIGALNIAWYVVAFVTYG